MKEGLYNRARSAAVLTVCEENANGVIMEEGWRRQSRLKPL